MDEPLLSVRDLAVEFQTDDGVVNAVDGVSFNIRKGETLGLVGESGCGKSVSAMSILRLIPQPPGKITRGSIKLDGEELLQAPIDEMQRIRGRDVAVIFQEPMTALNPLHRIGRQITEGLRLHQPELTKAQLKNRAIEWMEKVGLPAPERQFKAFPHQLSGGMRQRVMIAMAMIMKPKLLIADEPSTALDVTIQAQIMDLIRQMHKETGMALLLITHDLALVAEMCQRVVVMYAGKVAEVAPIRKLFKEPAHPYTKALLRSIPSVHTKSSERLPSIPGQVPSPMEYKKGCRFADRCDVVESRCQDELPAEFPLADDHRAACFKVEP